MAVMAREEWTDSRLDDLNKKVDDGFTEMRGEFKFLRQEFKSVRDEKEEIGGVRSELKEEIRGVRSEMTEIRSELGALNRTIHQFLFAVVGTIFLGFMGTIAALIAIVPR